MDNIQIIGRVRLQEVKGKTFFDKMKLRYFTNSKLLGSFLKVSPIKYDVLQDTGFGQNIITNTGKAAMAGLFGNTGSITAFQYLAVGTSATAAAITDTTLGSEIVDTGLARTIATISRTTTSVTNDTTNLTFTWTASGVKTINEIGIFNASSSGIMAARKVLGSPVTTNNGNSIIATYTVQFT